MQLLIQTIRMTIPGYRNNRLPFCPQTYLSFGLKKLVIFDMLAVLTFLSISTPRLLAFFLLFPAAAAALSALFGRFVGGIEAARAAADILARCVSSEVKLASALVTMSRLAE